MESVEADAESNQLRTLVLERLPDRLSALLGVSVRLGPDEHHLSTSQAFNSP